MAQYHSSITKNGFKLAVKSRFILSTFSKTMSKHGWEINLKDRYRK